MQSTVHDQPHKKAVAHLLVSNPWKNNRAFDPIKSSIELYSSRSRVWFEKNRLTFSNRPKEVNYFILQDIFNFGDREKNL